MNELFEIQERIGRLEFLIARLIETNQDIPVIVEGEQDVRTLRKLGLQGTILKVHSGKTLYEFCLDLSERYSRVVLLMDWDNRGQQIHTQLARDLEADWMPYDSFRQCLKLLCHPEIQEVEQLARHLQTLKHIRDTTEEENHNHAD